LFIVHVILNHYLLVDVYSWTITVSCSIVMMKKGEVVRLWITSFLMTSTGI